MDPSYRTISGFCTLLEKEWMAYGTANILKYISFRSALYCKWLIESVKTGFKFGQRIDKKKDKKKESGLPHAPLFLAFMDAVWQLWNQVKRYPTFYMYSYHQRCSY